MNLRSVAQAAVSSARFNSTLLAGLNPPVRTGGERFWVGARRLIRHWSSQLEGLADESSQAQESALGELLEKLLTCECLTRVWAAGLVAAQQRFHLEWAEPLARQTFEWQLDLKIRMLAAYCRCLESREQELEPADEVNQLRRRLERWTDLLLGALHSPRATSNFAYDVRRVADAAGSFRPDDPRTSPWPLIEFACPEAVPDRQITDLVTRECLLELVAAVDGLIPDTCFSNEGPLRSRRLTRLGLRGA